MQALRVSPPILGGVPKSIEIQSLNQYLVYYGFGGGGKSLNTIKIILNKTAMH
jgi:hypothetical protein